MTLNHRTLHTLGLYAILILSLASAGRLSAQNLTLEGQTGGFITPTAYSVYMEKGQTFSHPVVGYHFVGTAKVIGNIQTVSILEGFKNRGEIGYTRSIHTFGDSGSSTPLQLSQLWHYSGMNIFNGKVVLLNDNREGWKPGLAVGGVVRTGDKFVTGAVGQELAGLEGILQSAKASTNNDLYVAVSKTRLKAPVPFLLNAGWKVTNASIFGIGGQSTRYEGRLFGGLGIPLPGPFKTAIVPAMGFTQEPPQVKNLGAILVGGSAHLPTTMDYAVRVTQKDNAHFAFDIGMGKVAGQIGSTAVPTGLPSPYPPYVVLPINLKANSVVGTGLSIRY